MEWDGLREKPAKVLSKSRGEEGGMLLLIVDGGRSGRLDRLFLLFCHLCLRVAALVSCLWILPSDIKASPGRLLGSRGDDMARQDRGDDRANENSESCAWKRYRANL